VTSATPGPAAPIRVVIVDDQALIRAGFRLILETEPGIDVVGEAGDGHEALEVVRWRRPDIVLMDIQMPGMDGLDATRRLLSDPEASAPAPKVIVLTTFELDEYVYEALRAGASAFLLKNAPPEELLGAIRVVRAGGALLAPSVAARVIRTFAQRRPRDVAAKRLAPLTEREREILVLMARGMSNTEIAGALVVGEAPVKTHVSSILGKLEVRDRVGAVIAAYEGGLIEVGDAG
jgi:DNA-binding NarL/FixJ family response regulator